MRVHCNFTSSHHSQPSPDHPFLVIRCIAPSLLVRRRLAGIRVRGLATVTIMATIIACLRLATIQGISLFFLARRGRLLRSGLRLGDCDAISISCGRYERCNTKILVGTTCAFDAVGELGGQLLRTAALRVLGDMSQYARISNTMDSMYFITVVNHLAIRKDTSRSITIRPHR